MVLGGCGLFGSAITQQNICSSSETMNNLQINAGLRLARPSLGQTQINYLFPWCNLWNCYSRISTLIQHMYIHMSRDWAKRVMWSLSLKHKQRTHMEDERCLCMWSWLSGEKRRTFCSRLMSSLLLALLRVWASHPFSQSSSLALIWFGYWAFIKQHTYLHCASSSHT